MELQDVRKKINNVDEQLIDLFDERLECSAKVAEVKLVSNDDVYKPLREKEIYARYGDDNSGQMHKSFVKKIMQLSRKFQYNEFINQGIVDEDFYNWIEDKSVFVKGGLLKLTLLADKSLEKGLNINNILELVADTNLLLLKVSALYDTQSVIVDLRVRDTEKDKQEALTLAYMLYKETIK